MDFITSTSVRTAGERIEIVHHRAGEAPVTLTLRASEAEGLARALAGKAAEARTAEREAQHAAEAGE